MIEEKCIRCNSKSYFIIDGWRTCGKCGLKVYKGKDFKDENAEKKPDTIPSPTGKIHKKHHHKAKKE